jgi:hypothetical protein
LRRVLGVAQHGGVLRRRQVGELEVDRAYGHSKIFEAGRLTPRQAG